MTAVQTVMAPDRSEGIRCADTSHRSYSSDRRFDQCAFLEHAIIDLGIRDAMGPEACVGSAVDAALCALIAGDRKSPDIAHLLTLSIEELGDPRVRGLWDRDAMLEKAIALVELAEREALPAYEAHGGVYATQLEIHFEIDGTPFHVHIDCILGDGTVVDWKTSEKRLPDRHADTSPQLPPYFLAVQREYGHTPPALWLDGLIYANPPKDVLESRPGLTKPWFDRQIGHRTPAQIDAWLDDFSRREAARRWSQLTGIYPTQGRSALPFVCAGCAARSVCPSWSAYL